MGKYSDDVALEQLYVENEKLLGEQKALWGSDESGYRQEIDRIGNRRRRVWDRIRRRKAELRAASSQE